MWAAWFSKGADFKDHSPNHRKFYNTVIGSARAKIGQGLDAGAAESDCKSACKSLIKKLRSFSLDVRHEYVGKSDDRIEIVIFLDEAHPLARLVVHDPDSADNRRTGLFTMERALKSLLKFPVFCIYMSTNSQLEGLATPAAHHPSLRDGSTFRLFPPLNEFVGFDLFPAEIGREIFSSGVTLNKIASGKMLSTFGRPQ